MEEVKEGSEELLSKCHPSLIDGTALATVCHKRAGQPNQTDDNRTILARGQQITLRVKGTLE